MGSLGIPWTFVYGNHDTERLTTTNLFVLEDRVFETFKLNNKHYKGGKLLYYNENNKIDGRSNMVIELINNDNKINTVFYLLDSNSYINNNFNNYDFVHKNQIEWYKEKVNEDVCTTKNDSTLFDTVTSLGSTKAIFYGHDHYNNISLEYKGDRLTYGMSIDYLASPGIENKSEQRGATLITIKNDSSFDIKQIKLDTIKH